MMDFLLKNVSRVVVKLGTNTLAPGRGKLDLERMRSLCAQVASLRKRGIEVIIVSSGAIGLGMGKLGFDKRPTDLPTLQACAAIGQTVLMECWQTCLQSHDITCAQVLLTHEDVRSRSRHLAVKETLERLLKLSVVPIVNENDTVSTEEIRFGDNDMLSALTASLSAADLLVILSTVPGLMDLKGSGEVVPLVPEITPEIEAMAGGTDSPYAVGGMSSKIAAARVATKSECGVFIGDGSDPLILLHLLAGRATGTFFVPANATMGAKKRWMAFFESPSGIIHVDAGAAEALRRNGSSLLAKGIVRSEGRFAPDSVVRIIDPAGQTIARGITRFSNEEVEQIAGKDSDAIRQTFPDRRRLEVVHRDALVLV